MSLRRLPAGRRTNLALLALVAAALVTGAFAFAIGVPWVRWVAASHAVVGIAILLLAPWKSAISARGLRRRRGGSWASVLLAGLVVVVVATGLAHSTGLLRSFAGLSAMRVHVGAALVAIPIALWHVVARPVRPRRTDLSRRALLRGGALLGGSVAVFGAAEGLVRAASLPGADRRFTGSYETASFHPDAMPVTQWLNDTVPTIDAEGWRLVVGGRALSYEELTVFDDRIPAALDCTGGWWSEQEWEGARLSRLLGVPSDARSIVVTSATGYSRRFPIAGAGELLLATRVGGEPLSPGHGFPARIVAPGRRGFWWVKWVEGIALDGAPWWWQPPFPLT